MQARLELVHEAAKGGVTDKRHAPLLFVHGAYCGAWCWQQHFLPWFAARGYDCWAVSPGRPRRERRTGLSGGHQY
ncbi:hypothetical protein [Paludibacterium denitrificans]|uniref:hypothetical protein n=1 Tax=Paludibacterium denitrificans TaxID=2675226 RepID=UPI001E5CDEBA|nr:hypothetical protein [Paludibacterium denitrificans]